MSDLTVEIVSSPIQVTRGEPVSYVVNLANGGSSTVNDVTLEADTPAGFTLSAGHHHAGNVQCGADGGSVL